MALIQRQKAEIMEYRRTLLYPLTAQSEEVIQCTALVEVFSHLPLLPLYLSFVFISANYTAVLLDTLGNERTTYVGGNYNEMSSSILQSSKRLALSTWKG